MTKRTAGALIALVFALLNAKVTSLIAGEMGPSPIAGNAFAHTAAPCGFWVDESFHIAALRSDRLTACNFGQAASEEAAG